MTSEGTLTSEITHKQIENEQNFVASVYMGGGALEVQQYGWLNGSVFVDRDLGNFWDKVKQHGDPLRALNEANIPQSDMLRWMTYVPTSLRSDEYVRVIAEMHYLRTAANDAQELLRAIRAEDVSAYQSKIMQMGKMMPLGVTDDATFNKLGPKFTAFRQAISAGVGKVIKTGLPEIDKLIGGMMGGQLIIVAARPSTGKTALCLQIARQVAVTGKKVLFLSLEMPDMQLIARMACGTTLICWEDVCSGNVSSNDLARLDNEVARLQGLYGDKLIIYDHAWLLQDIYQTVAHYMPDLVIIDHLGEITREPAGAKAIEWYPRALTGIRHYVARSLNIPTVVIHQLNRNVEAQERRDKRPVLPDLRDSGEIEQLADTVLMGYREDMYNPKMQGLNKVEAEWWVRKNRQGRSNSCATFNYDLQQQWFYPINQSPMAP